MKIVPEPLLIELKEGKPFVFNAVTRYENAEFEDDVFADFKKFFEDMDFTDLPEVNNEIKLILDGRLAEDEYKLSVAENRVVINASGRMGALLGLQTLKQLVTEYGGKIELCLIKDKPRFKYRAFMLDSGRYFYPVEDVKRFIDLMAAHKLNYFHWHLTEDQGFRVEIKKYPALTTWASKRSHTNFNVFKPHEGFYSAEDVKEIVKYCHERCIKVVPEFDIPGHCVAAISAYSYLGCFDRKLKVATHWGVKHDILCVGKESTYKFVQDVIDELCELFPDEYFHMGGDEAVKTRWKICPDCQAKIEKLGLKDEEELQQVFMTDIHKYLLTKGKKSIMWNWDIAKDSHCLDKNIIWQLCANLDDETICKQINAGRNVIISNSYANYFDFPYAWVNLEMTYKNPVSSDKLDEKGSKRILGVEAPLWTEYVPNMKRAEYLTFPRMGAMAESAWTSPENIKYKRFIKNIDTYYNYLDKYSVGYAKGKQISPIGVNKFFGSLWFNRRQLHWQGLHNLIDNALVKIKYGKNKRK